MIIYQEFLAMNEDMASFDPSERLRYAVHEIIITMRDSQITFKELSGKLQKDFKINISDDLLKSLFSAWDRFNDADYSIFKKEDKEWMDVFPYQNYIRRKTKDKQSFGKHRKKDIPATTTTNNQNYAGGYYDNTGKWHSYSTTRFGKTSYEENDKYYRGWD